MDPFPPSRAEAVRIARERGEALGVKVLPAGSQRRLQPVVDKFFYGLRANAIETQRLGRLVGEPHARRRSGRSRRSWRCSGTATSPPARTRCATTG